MIRKTLLSALAGGAVMLAAAQGQSAELKIGLSSSVTSLDPIFYVVGPNSAMARNMFDGLINQDAKQQLQPALAVSWKPVNDTTWEFKLRQGVKFHDGSTFDAEDVAATIRRVPLAAENSPSSFKRYVREIKGVEIVDPYTIRFTTDGPAPLLPNNLSRISIMPAELEKMPTQKVDNGEGVIGTGPFKFVSWQRDDRVEMVANPDYWGGAPKWDKVTFKFIANNGARVAALLSGDVDLIENVPTTDIKHGEQARWRRRHRYPAATGSCTCIWTMTARVSPHAAGPDGKNPLRDVRVRRALSMSINRDALIDRIMDGQGVPAGQLVPEGYFGWSPNIQVPKFDPKGAKALLADAGYPNGFKMTSHASNDRYPNDEKIAQAIGQMFSKIGLDISVVTLPKSVYFSRASAREFSFIMGGAAVETGEASGVLGPLLATYDKSKGQGAGNRGRYSSPEFDEAYNTALKTVDGAAREKLLQKAMEIGMNDVGVIPVFFLAHNWGLKDSLKFQPRSDGYTLAYLVEPK